MILNFDNMSNSQNVAHSEVIFLEALLSLRPDVLIIVEQHSQSFMFKTDVFQEFIARRGLRRTLTWMGYWGAPILKPTHLLSNMMCLGGCL